MRRILAALLGAALLQACVQLPDALPALDADVRPDAAADAAPAEDAPPAPDAAPADAAPPEPDAGPRPEVCNGADDDLDGRLDEGVRNGCGGCGPVPDEVCDDFDNDCDFSVDEIESCACAPGAERPCGVDVGECSVGVQVCRDGGSWTPCSGRGPDDADPCDGLDGDCDGEVDEDERNRCGACGPEPAELCNGEDDDCDGAVDEGARNRCGGCGAEPVERCNREDDDCDGAVDEDACGCALDTTRPCGTDEGRCRPGEQRCDVDGWGPCLGAIGPESEVCDGSDDDCDGATDEDACVCALGSTRPCGVSTGVCERGTQTCDPAGWGPCEGEVGPVGERCNGLDDDCDGAADEDWPGLGEPCEAGVGACRRAGVRVCGGGGGGALTCDAQAGAAAAERCNGVDDDCDGATDEAPLPMPEGCIGEDGCVGEPRCQGGEMVCFAPAALRETCDGTDEDCDGAVDEGTGGAPCQTGQPGVCAAGRALCDRGAIVCRPSNAGRPEGQLDSSTCNGLDDDCDGAVDEDQPRPRDCLDGLADYRCVDGAPVACAIEPGPEPIPR